MQVLHTQIVVEPIIEPGSEVLSRQPLRDVVATLKLARNDL
jgi:hypothetical protein